MFCGQSGLYLTIDSTLDRGEKGEDMWEKSTRTEFERGTAVLGTEAYVRGALTLTTIVHDTPYTKHLNEMCDSFLL